MGGAFQLVLLLLLFGSGHLWNPEMTVGQIWPFPQNVTFFPDVAIIKPLDFMFRIPSETCETLKQAVLRYAKVINNISRDVRSCSTSGPTLTTVDVQLSEPCEEWPHLMMDEHYEVHVKSSSAVIASSSLWGVLRGLETFSQLITPSPEPGCLMVNHTDVLDFPRFPHRGLLVDTSRHFLPLNILYTILSAMEMNKMNVFHWHIVDDQSFPYQSRVFPSLSNKGAYDPERFIYTQEDVENIIEYARQRGIRVVPEFDSPGHTQSWGKGTSKLLTSCYDSNGTLDGKFGPIDPSRSENYKFMETLLKEVREVFKDDYIHIGGDEVDYSCWISNPAINSFMKEKNISSYEQLESYYIKEILSILNNISSKGIVWQEVFFHNANLRNDTVVHVWNGDRASLLEEVTSQGKFALLSADWYLDHISRQWEDYYKVDPTDFNGTKAQKDLVMGGEACMWGEMVDETNVVARVWPRASAVAERLWSNTKVNKVKEAEARLNEHVCRMKRRGVSAQPANGPGFCPWQ